MLEEIEDACDMADDIEYISDDAWTILGCELCRRQSLH
jgi:hypothetical protein